MSERDEDTSPPDEPTDDEAAILAAAEQLGAVRAVMSAIEGRLPDIQDAIEENVNNRTRPWKILAGVAALAAVIGVAVGAIGVNQAHDAKNDLEIAVVGGCDNANEVRQGFLDTLTLLTGGPPEESDDEEVRAIAPLFALKNCDYDALIEAAKKKQEDE